MSVSDHMYRTAKWKARIVTCDPPTGRIEAILGDGAIRQIGASGIDGAFRWPIEGEVWTVRQENNDWVLGERWQDDTEAFLVSDMQPGELRLDSNTIKDSQGRIITELFARVTALESAMVSTGKVVVPLGGTIEWNASGDPAGGLFMVEDGRTLNSVSDPTLAPLFGVIGTTWGGTGASSFKIPDAAGRAAMGAGSGAGLTTRALAAKMGTEPSNMPSHSHLMNFVNGSTTNTDDNFAYIKPGSGINTGSFTAPTFAAGGGGADNIMPTIVKNKIIRVR